VPHASSASRIAQQVGGSFHAAILQIQIAAHHAGGLAGRVAAFDDAWSIGLTAIAVLPALALPGRPRRTLGEPTSAEGGMRDVAPARPAR
jgi:hypothetical protein